MRSLVRLPKAHLHVHREGAMRPATLAELAGERGLRLPDPSGGFALFEDFGPLYGAAARLVREGPRENLLRLVREVVEDAVADGRCGSSRTRSRRPPKGPRYAGRTAALALTDPQLAAVARTSVESSGAPRAVVEDALALIGDWLSTEGCPGPGTLHLKSPAVTAGSSP